MGLKPVSNRFPYERMELLFHKEKQTKLNWSYNKTETALRGQKLLTREKFGTVIVK